MTASLDTPSTYVERLRVPFRWWVQGTMLVASLWLATIVALPSALAWAVAAAAMVLLAAALLAFGSARVAVDDEGFLAGRARIPGRFLGRAEALDADQTRRVAGPDADARAYLLLRPYLARAVRVEITDPADPAPYWLVSSRRPEALAAALQRLTERRD
ncbi:DUF3093 domain-containing protein [Nocardioides sp.]|uniref:DUF3093 domain-containing protein n=1 Tax=Nocardioides sp. TaxID=35761 RepID=UPI00356673B9